MINLKNTYNRQNYIDHFEDVFLPEDFEQNFEKLPTQNKYIKSIELMGQVDSLELKVYEVLHESENDPRVSLSKEFFKFMRTYFVKRAIVIFRSTNSENFRLSLVTIEFSLEGKKVSMEYSNPRRYSYFLGPDCKEHTPQNALKDRVENFKDLQNRFSVEVVNKEFYTKIAILFTKLVGGKRKIGSRTTEYKPSLKLPSTDDHKIMQEFAVRLIGRTIFCWFLKKKTSNNDIPLLPQELLSTKKTQSTNNYYHKILEPLFFEILNTAVDDRIQKYQTEPWNLIPFLNGGLFEPNNYDYYEIDNTTGVSRFEPTLIVPNEWIYSLLEIFELYNFTIDENTSIDIELSIEPEMLGRIFENLLAEINPETGETARKNTGSYYTPRPIVDFMVDESLKHYLLANTSLSNTILDELLNYTSEMETLSEEENLQVIDALDKLKIIDPACGSGAFPMGILQKMLLILERVDPDSIEWVIRQLEKIPNKLVRETLEEKLMNESWTYKHKMGIIQHSIYGVDIQSIATEISKLRLFLTLVVDENVVDNKPNRDIHPLPNLEFKFVTANSLIGLPQIEKNTQMELSDYDYKLTPLLNKLAELREKYFYSSGDEKIEVEEAFKKTQKEISKFLSKNKTTNKRAMTISNWDPFSNQSVPWFDPKWMFGIDDGFDIVITNPPYGANLESRIQKYYREKYEFVQFKVDSYVLFIIKIMEILDKNGTSSIIIPNTFLNNYFLGDLREYLINGYQLDIVINFKESVFKAIVHSLVIQFTKNIPTDDFQTKIGYDVDGSSFSIDQSYYNTTPNNSILLVNDEETKLLSKISDKTIPFDSVIDLRQAIKSGNDSKFIATSQKTKNYKPILRGRDIQKCHINPPGLFINYGSHLACPRDPNIFEQPHILIRETGSQIISTLDNDNYYVMSSLYCGILINSNYSLEYILGLLNSKLFLFLLNKYNFENTSGVFTKAKIYHYNQLPIKKVALPRQKILGDIVKELLIINSNKISKKTIDLQSDIDRIVNELYGLTLEEIDIINKNVN